MLEQELERLYRLVRLRHYQQLFGRIREREGSLSATEAFACDVVYLLGTPTIKQLAEALGISQSNASYKVNNLTAKGYIRRVEPGDDKRESRITVADRFYNYYDAGSGFLAEATARLRESFSPEELETFEKMLRALDSYMD